MRISQSQKQMFHLVCNLNKFEGRFTVTREEGQVEREWFTVKSERRYAGRLELRVLYVGEKTSY